MGVPLKEGGMLVVGAFRETVPMRSKTAFEMSKSEALLMTNVDSAR